MELSIQNGNYEVLMTEDYVRRITIRTCYMTPSIPSSGIHSVTVTLAEGNGDEM